MNAPNFALVLRHIAEQRAEEANAHVHEAVRGVLNAFAETQLDEAERWAEIDRERRQEWRQDDAESARDERDQQEEARWPR